METRIRKMESDWIMGWFDCDDWGCYEPSFYEEEQLEKGIWCAKDREVLVVDMSLSHLENTIRKITRDGWREWALPALTKEYKRRMMK